MSQTETPETRVRTDKHGGVTLDAGVGGMHIIHVPYFGSIRVIVGEFEKYNGEIHRFSHITLHTRADPNGDSNLTIFAESLDIKKKYVEANNPEPHNFKLIASR